MFTSTMSSVILSVIVRFYLPNWVILFFLTFITLASFSHAAVRIKEPLMKEEFFGAGEKALLSWNYTVDDRSTELRLIAFKWSVAVPPYSTTKKTIIQELKDGTREVGSDIPSFLRNRTRVINRATLEITDLNQNDSNTYFFEVLTNSVGTLSSSVNLTVTEPPVAQVRENSVVASMAETTLICEATGVPVPEIKWTKWDNIEKLPSTENIIGGRIYSNLTFISNLENVGEYVCTAKIPTGETSNTSVYFSVENIRATTHEVVVEDCNSQSPCCPVFGFPQPLYRWTFHNGTSLTESKLCLSKSKAAIGKYVCHARNSNGSVSVNVTCGQEPTSEIRTMQMDNSKVNISWNIPGKVIYLIEAKENGRLCYISNGKAKEAVVNYYSLDSCTERDPLELIVEVQIKTGNKFTLLRPKTITLGTVSSAMRNYQAGFTHVVLPFVVVLSTLWSK